MEIKIKLGRNLNLKNPDTVTHSLLNDLTPTLAQLSKYIYDEKPSDSSLSEQKEYPSEKTESLEDKHDIAFVNNHLAPLKKLL